MRKFNRPTDQRMSVMRSLATNLLWYGKIETTLEKAKEVRTYAEKLLTKAINTYEDVVKVNKTVTDAKGVKSQKEVVNDGAKKLAARRDIMSKLYDIQEQRAEKESKGYQFRYNVRHGRVFAVAGPSYITCRGKGIYRQLSP